MIRQSLSLLFRALLLALPTSFALAQIDQDDLLPPDQAFKVSGEVVDADTARFTWQIADGYYLYKSKLRVDSAGGDLVTNELSLPPGELRHDDYFGEVETYRQRVSFEVPLTRNNGDAGEVQFIAKSQGCADIGVCYPPQARTVTLNLPAATLASSPAPPPAPVLQPAPLPSLATGSSLDGLPGLTAGVSQDQEFLDPDVAFVASAQMQDAGTVVASWAIADGYYLYRHRFNFELIDAQGVTLGEAAIPEGKHKEDEFFGEVETYYHDIKIPIPVSPALSEGQELTLKVGFQGCADAGLCYPPQKLSIPVIFTAASVGEPASGAATVAAPATSSAATVAVTDANAAVPTKAKAAPMISVSRRNSYRTCCVRPICCYMALKFHRMCVMTIR